MMYYFIFLASLAFTHLCIAMSPAQMMDYTQKIDTFLDSDPKEWNDEDIATTADLIYQLDQVGVQRSQIPQWRKRLKQQAESAGKIKALEFETKFAGGRLKKMGQQIAQEEKRAKTAEQIGAQLKKDLSQTKSQLDKTQKEQARFESLVKDKENELASLKSSYAKLETAAQKSKSDLDDALSQYQKQQIEKEAVESKLAAYEAALAKQKKEADEYVQQLNGLIDTQSRQKNKLAKEIELLKAQIEAQQKDLDEAQLTGKLLTETQKQLDDQSKSLATLKVQSTESDAQIAELKKQLEEAQALQEKTKKEFEALQQKKETELKESKAKTEKDLLEAIEKSAAQALKKAQALDLTQFDKAAWDDFIGAVQQVIKAEENAKDVIKKTKPTILESRFGGPQGPLLSITNAIEKKLNALVKMIKEENKRQVLNAFNKVLEKWPDSIKLLLKKAKFLDENRITPVVEFPALMKSTALENLVGARDELIKQIDEMQSGSPKVADDIAAHTAHVKKVLALIDTVSVLKNDKEIQQYRKNIDETENPKEKKAKADLILTKARQLLKQVEDEPEIAMQRGTKITVEQKTESEILEVPTTSELEIKASKEERKLELKQVMEQVDALFSKLPKIKELTEKNEFIEEVLQLVSKLPSNISSYPMLVNQITFIKRKRKKTNTINGAFKKTIEALGTIKEQTTLKMAVSGVNVAVEAPGAPQPHTLQTQPLTQQPGTEAKEIQTQTSSPTLNAEILAKINKAEAMPTVIGQQAADFVEVVKKIYEDAPFLQKNEAINQKYKDLKAKSAPEAKDLLKMIKDEVSK